MYISDTRLFYNKELKNKNAYIIESTFGVEYSINNEMKNKINLGENKDHLRLEESIELLNKYKGRKTTTFIFSHLNSNTLDSSVIEKECKKLSNKKLSVNYIKPNDINNRTFEF